MDLENRIRHVEEENSLIRNFNEIYGKENDTLHAELERSRNCRIPRSATQQGLLNERPSKKLKAKENSPDEDNAMSARVRTRNLQSNYVNTCIQLFANLLLLFRLK